MRNEEPVFWIRNGGSGVWMFTNVPHITTTLGGAKE